MTAIYASYSKNEKKFAMGADNLEGNQGQIVSKIRFIIDRYVIGVAGCDNPIQAVDIIVSQNSTDELIRELDNIAKLVKNVCLWTKEYTEAQILEHGNKENAESQFSTAQNMTTTLIIFDVKEFELYECDLSYIFPPESFIPDKVKPELLQEGKLLLFALAQTRYGNNKVANLPADFYLDVKKSFEKMIHLDQITLDSERVIQGSEKVPFLGNLGTYCFYEHGKVFYFKNV